MPTKFEYTRGKNTFYLPVTEEPGVSRFELVTLVRELGMNGRAPAVCSALKSRRFWQPNNLRLVEISGPKSGQSTTVTYTYKFVEIILSTSQGEDPWIRLRGALKGIFAELGGGEAYLRGERGDF
jgi:hypothetical protein